MNREKESLENNVCLKIAGVNKKYPGVQALNDVSLELKINEILGIAGENGAGKSTLLKILAGVEPPDSGEMYLRGKKYSPKNLREANIIGVSMVFQEQNLVNNLRVYENLFLSHEQVFNKFGLLPRRRMIAEAGDQLRSYGINIDPKAPMGSYSFHDRQMIEIVRAFVVARIYGIETPIILLDEPTASLPDEERGIVLERIKSFASYGVLVLISHRLSELMNLCQRVVVFKDGCLVGEVSPSTATERDIHSMMVGRELMGDVYRINEQREDQAGEDVMLKVEGLKSRGAYESVDFELKRGEILGIGGLLGSGKTMLGESLFGVRNLDAGTVSVKQGTVRKLNTQKMVGMGVGYVPRERKECGIINSLSVAWNLSIPSLRKLKSRWFGVIDRKMENRLIDSALQKFRIKARKEDKCFSLSGGNQQKIVLSKWMIQDLTFLIMDNPTRGIDIGAKEDIYTFIRQIVKQGLSILLISDDLLELIGLSNRIIIMKDGKISKIVDAPSDHKPSEQEVVGAMV